MARPGSAGLPACPRHPQGHVKKAGRYGKGKRRQLFRCTPRGGKKHAFVGTLPRLLTATGDCAECERRFNSLDGPHAVRYYHYSIRDIAWALTRVGAGNAYREVAENLRRRVDHPTGMTLKGDLIYSRDARLVADWIELYAPRIGQRLLPDPSPETLILDHIPFHVSDRHGHPGQTPKRSGKAAFFVFTAAGHTPGSSSQMIRMECSPSKDTASWSRFLGQFHFTPTRIVCDQETALVNAVRARWPGIAITISPWHLQRQAFERLRRAKRHAPDDMLQRALKVAFWTKIYWDAFAVLARRSKIKELIAWVDLREPLILQQFQTKVWPVSTGALERQARIVKNMLFDRRDAFRNRRRTDLLLDLITLKLLGKDDERVYSRIIREVVHASHGRGGTRGKICDPAGTSSLRARGTARAA